VAQLQKGKKTASGKQIYYNKISLCNTTIGDDKSPLIYLHRLFTLSETCKVQISH